MKIDEMFVAIQKKLRVQADGRAGPETWGAIYALTVRATISGEAPPEAIEPVDERSETNIATLPLEVQPIARSLVQKAALNGIQIKIISGFRTYAEQNKLYAQGRTKSVPKVTNAREGYSNHNFRVAFDAGIFEGRKYLGESVKYRAVGVLGTDLGLEWGGNWTSIVDQPHFQLRPSWATDYTAAEMLPKARSRVSNEAGLFA